MDGIVNGKEVKSLSDITPTSSEGAKEFTASKYTWTGVPSDCAFIFTGAVYGWWWNLIFVNAGYALYGGSTFTSYTKPQFSLPNNNIVGLYYYSTTTGTSTLQYNVATKQIYWNFSGVTESTMTFYYW